ncbi:hypothetical protein [Hydrogenophaga sp. PML113]|uniref:hypothetical protein n=1 Tax=Hydrogenophaga sp. PML113 TaxID=1899350 RepID=UPI000877F3BB|nr:hypothetical protein [Hydrogenophaga sp. PML113]
MHIRFARAAVTAELSPSDESFDDMFSIPQAGTDVPRSNVLWASPALSVPAGRLLGVRRFDQAVQVALIKPGEDRLRWVASEAVLSEFQARTWAQTSRFSPGQ